jgi:hypothetical protein
MYPARTGVQWRRSTFCANSTCVEIALIDGAVALRDSKNVGAGVLTYTPEEFRAFVDGVKAGQFDDLLA